MNELAVMNEATSLVLKENNMSAEQYALIKRTYCKCKDEPVSDDEFWMYIQYCKARNVSVTSQEIYFAKYNGKVNFLTSYHYMLARCQETRQFEGMTLALFCGTDGAWKEIWTEKNPPFACKVGVYRSGCREPIYSIRYFEEALQANPQWKKQPLQMLRKCAIADALRLAFDDVLRGIYIKEEMPEAGETLQPPRFEQQPQITPPTMPTLPDTTQERWEFDEIPDYYLPPELRGKKLSFERLATDETLVWQDKKARYILHHWSTSRKWDERIKAIANLLLEKYPSKGKAEPQEQEVQPPENVIAGMPAQ